MRVAHLTTSDMSLALLLATELKVDLAAGHTVLGLSAPGRYVPQVEESGAIHVPLSALTRSWSPWADARAFIQLLRTLRRLDLDVLHTHNPKTGVMGRIAGRMAGIPVVVNTCHGLWATPEDSWPKRLFVYGLEGLAAQFSDYELFQNADDARTLRRFLHRGRWSVVGNGVDLERFRPDPEGRKRVRGEWGIPDGRLVVGTVGRRVAEKGLTEFGTAAAALSNEADFIWVGPDDVTGPRVDLPPTVRFIPERFDMPAVYSAFDIFVLASYREGFSRASMEAAACGLPLVLSDIRGCREIGTPGEHAVFVPPRDAGALQRAIADLLDDPDARARIGAAARVRSRDAFDQRDVAAESLAAYRTAQAGKGGQG